MSIIDVEYEIAEDPSFLTFMAHKPSSEWMTMFGFISNSLSISIQEKARPIIESVSLPRVMLNRDNYLPGKKYERDICEITYVISRRGAIPDVIREGPDYDIPTFQIAANPSLPIDAIINKDIQSLRSMTLKSIDALAREEDANFSYLLDTASMNRSPIISPITLESLGQAYNLLLEYGQTPKYLLVRPSIFTSLHNESITNKGNWKFEDLQSQNKTFGHYQGAQIKISDRISNVAYFIAENAGHFIEKQQISALICPSPTKLRGTIVMWEEIGMSISGSMVSCVKCV